MSNFRLAAATQNAIANVIKTLTDANGGAGTISFYDGTQPASANAAVTTQQLLAVLTFSNPSFPQASGGTISTTAIPARNAVATGTCSWARVADAAGNTVCDCDVGTSGATISLNTIAIVKNGPVVVTSFAVTVPSG